MSYPDNYAILFDLDMTLVDTSALLELRNKRKWGEVYKKFDHTYVYPNVRTTIEHFGLYYKVGIVTSSPRKYAEKLLAHHGLDIPVIAAYHDTEKHKPNPDPILFAIEKMGLDPKNDVIITIGDEINDIIASKRANEKYGLNPQRWRPFDSFENEFNPYIDRLFLNYHDIGVNAYGVSWGQNTSNELIEAGAMFIIYDFSDIECIFGAGYGVGEWPPELLDDDNHIIPNISNHFHIVNYYPKNSTFHDDWSRFILKFKDGDYRTIKKWGAVTFEQFSPEWVFLEHQFHRVDIIVRALSSEETSAIDYHPLDTICEKIERATKGQYLKQLLKKKQTTRQLKYLSKSEREKEIEGNYYYDLSSQIQIYGLEEDRNYNILIVDDILTTGLTASSIAKAIKQELPKSTVNLFTLGKTSNPEFGGPKDNSHMQELII